METMKFYTEEEILDKHIGKKGTPKRDQFEADLNSFLIGEAIKQARQSKNLTQEELGNLIGVQRAQISRIENGKNLTFSTIARVFKAMGISAKPLRLLYLFRDFLLTFSLAVRPDGKRSAYKISKIDTCVLLVILSYF